MRVYLEKRVVIGLVIALTILVGLGVLSFLNNQKFATASAWVAHTHDVLFQSEQLLAVVINAETGQRGYTITGSREFLKPYENSVPLVSSHFESLLRLTADNPSQQKKLAELRHLIARKMEFTAESVRLAGIGFERSKDHIQTMEGKELMDKIRFIIADFQGTEKALLQQRSNGLGRDIVNFDITFISLFIAIVIILIFIFLLINKHLKARIHAERSLQKASAEVQDLYENAPCGYHSLDGEGFFVTMNQTMLSWLQYSRDEVIGRLKFENIASPASSAKFAKVFPSFKAQGSINNLEFEILRKDGTAFPVILNALAIFNNKGQYVRSRTTVFDNSERKQAENKLIAANQELESFTYTLSHDLRAPLRSLNGYSQILEADYGPAFDEEGKRLLSVVSKNARQMGQLIDDLLEFSRVGKKEMQKTQVAMDDIIRPIVNELVEKEQEKGRKIEIIIYRMENAFVDFKMMAQVWINLISNALKYSGKKEKARLEIGSYPSPPETIFYIRDNGIGFDMAYIDKLFGVFQRLHKMQDFEGTGVGLAIVKRIIDRHRGKVWAESAPGAGASFYFSIPNWQ